MFLLQDVRDTPAPPSREGHVLGEQVSTDALGDDGCVPFSRGCFSPESKPFFVGTDGVDEGSIGGPVRKYQRIGQCGNRAGHGLNQVDRFGAEAPVNLGGASTVSEKVRNSGWCYVPSGSG